MFISFAIMSKKKANKQTNKLNCKIARKKFFFFLFFLGGGGGGASTEFEPVTPLHSRCSALPAEP